MGRVIHLLTVRSLSLLVLSAMLTAIELLCGVQLLLGILVTSKKEASNFHREGGLNHAHVQPWVSNSIAISLGSSRLKEDG